jgi:hypothetical protein
MKSRELSVPVLALIAGTRVALGAGLGLLLADKMAPDSRRAAGWALFLCGALTTIPLAAEVLGLDSTTDSSERGTGRTAMPLAPTSDFSA